MRDDRSIIRSVRGPLILITLGVLFVLQNFTDYGIGRTWPVLLIVIGLLSLFGRTAPPVPGPPAPTQSTWPPPAGGFHPTYTQGPYPQAPQTTPPDAPPPASTPGGSV
jgi:hypothetical protein